MQAGVPSSLLSPQSTELWSRRETKDLQTTRRKKRKVHVVVVYSPNTNTPGSAIPRYKCVCRRGEEGVLLSPGSEDIFKGDMEGQ